MLVDTQYLTNSKQLVVSYVDDTGNIKLKYYPMEKPMKYEVCEHNDKDVDPVYTSWDSKPIKKVETSHPDRYAIYEYLDALPDSDKDEIFEYNEPKIYFVDIETEIVDGFPEAETADTRVLSISVVYDDKIILMGLKDMPMDMQDRIINNTNNYFKNFNIQYSLKYIKYDDEFDMLYQFFYKMVPKMPMITGWNFTKYDWVYLVNRSRKLSKVINGRKYSIDPSVSSFTKRLNKVWMGTEELPAHRMIFDYMQLYEIADTTVKVKESSSLDFVSEKILGVNKIKYTGSLQKLYEDDFETFMYYNAVDSALVQMIHNKANYIGIVYAISALSRIKISDVVSNVNNALASLAITEGVLRSRFREMENKILFKDRNAKVESDEKIPGGWVKSPAVGMNQWVACYDFASLYPMTQLEFYIAPETFMGEVDKKDNTKYLSITGNSVLIDDTVVVCNNGCVFHKRESPTLNMLVSVYADRKKNKKLMMQKKEEYKAIMDEIKKLELEI